MMLHSCCYGVRFSELVAVGPTKASTVVRIAVSSAVVSERVRLQQVSITRPNLVP